MVCLYILKMTVNQQVTPTIHICIFLECVDGYYDNMCRSVCGQCMHGEICDKYNGTCVNGCKPNFKTPFCKGKYKSEYV